MDAEGDLFRQYVAGRDVPCPGCGYNLRDLSTDRCPECGEHLKIALLFAEPKQAAAIAGLIGLSAGAGLGGLLLIYMLIMSIMVKPISSSEFDRFFGINGTGFLIHAIALAIWLRQWKHIRRATLAVRILLAGACWVLPLVFVIVFAVFIR